MQADAIFLSPPWGGPGYHPQKGSSYNIDRVVGSLGIGFAELMRIVRSALFTKIEQVALPSPSALAVRPKSPSSEKEIGKQCSEISKEKAQSSGTALESQLSKVDLEPNKWPVTATEDDLESSEIKYESSKSLCIEDLIANSPTKKNIADPDSSFKLSTVAVESFNSERKFCKEFRRVACFLPHAADFKQIVESLPDCTVEVEKAFLNKKLLAVTVYLKWTLYMYQSSDDCTYTVHCIRV